MKSAIFFLILVVFFMDKDSNVLVSKKLLRFLSMVNKIDISFLLTYLLSIDTDIIMDI